MKKYSIYFLNNLICFCCLHFFCIGYLTFLILFRFRFLFTLGFYIQITFVWFHFDTLFYLFFFFIELCPPICTVCNAHALITRNSIRRIHDNNLNIFFCCSRRPVLVQVCFVILFKCYTHVMQHFYVSVWFFFVHKDKKQRRTFHFSWFLIRGFLLRNATEKWYGNSENFGAVLFLHGNFIEIPASVRWCKAPRKYYTFLRPISLKFTS